MTDYVICPHCGSEITANATFCRHCGSSDSDGWKEATEGGFDDFDDEDEFDYEEFVEQEFSSSPVNRRVRPLWRWVAIVLLVLWVLAYVL